MAGWKKALFGAFTLLVALCLLEGGLSFVRALSGFGAVETMREGVHTEHDSELGWVNIKGFHDPNLYGDGRGYRTNAQGLRGSAEYPKRKPPATYRIIALGDSFTMGYGVDDADTYPAQLQSLVDGSEVVNMGMGGYGLGQDYLWYMRDGQDMQADLLLFAFIAHDFERLVLTNFMGYEKPRVQLQDDDIIVENTPVPTKSPWQGLGAGAALFLDRLALGKAFSKLLRPLSSAKKHQEYVGFEGPAAAIFDKLQAHSAKVGQDFALVYLPTLYGIRGELEPPHKWLLEHAKTKNVELIDLTPAFEALAPRELSSMYIPGDAHYSPKGNHFAAAALKRELSRRFPRFAASAGVEHAAATHNAPADGTPPAGIATYQ